MKRSLIALAAATAIGATALGTTLSLAHSDGPYGRPGWGHGMMGGYGPDAMGPGYGRMGHHGPAMMGYGMGPAMMGYGQGNAGVPCPGYAAANANAEPLTLDAARKAVEQRLAWMGNDRLKLGKIEAKGDNAFTAEIVTQDNSLVQRLEINRNTGFMRPVR